MTLEETIAREAASIADMRQNIVDELRRALKLLTQPKGELPPFEQGQITNSLGDAVAMWDLYQTVTAAPAKR